MTDYICIESRSTVILSYRGLSCQLFIQVRSQVCAAHFSLNSCANSDPRGLFFSMDIHWHLQVWIQLCTFVNNAEVLNSKVTTLKKSFNYWIFWTVLVKNPRDTNLDRSTSGAPPCFPCWTETLVLCNLDSPHPLETGPLYPERKNKRSILIHGRHNIITN